MVQVSSFSDAEESSSSSSGNSNTNSNNSGLKQNNSKPVLRQIMVPPALAASLQATGRQLMVITGPGGKKMIALRPLTSTGTYYYKRCRFICIKCIYFFLHFYY